MSNEDEPRENARPEHDGRNAVAKWHWRDAVDSLLAGATCLAAVIFLYWNLVVLLPDEMFMRSLDPLGKLAALRLALFLPLALLAGWVVALGYRRVAAHPAMANLLPGAAFATSLFVLMETRWVQAPFPGWFLALRALLIFVALPFGWWLLSLSKGGKR